MAAYVYILECSDGRYYVGTTRGQLEDRVNHHNAGTFGGYTKSRRPVRLVFWQQFDDVREAIAAERQLKGWSREKKQALIIGDIDRLKSCPKARRNFRILRQAQDEEIANTEATLNVSGGMTIRR